MQGGGGRSWLNLDKAATVGAIVAGWYRGSGKAVKRMTNVRDCPSSRLAELSASTCYVHTRFFALGKPALRALYKSYPACCAIHKSVFPLISTTSQCLLY